MGHWNFFYVPPNFCSILTTYQKKIKIKKTYVKIIFALENREGGIDLDGESDFPLVVHQDQGWERRLVDLQVDDPVQDQVDAGPESGIDSNGGRQYRTVSCEICKMIFIIFILF